MDRLTVKWTDKVYDTLDTVDILDNEYSKINYNKLLTKLGEYEDLEEQGLLLRLPCHIGDIIYEPTNRNTINEYRVTGIREEAFALWIEWKLEKGFVYQSIYGVEVGDIGKTVFLTQAEAERKLKEMESD